MLNSRHPSPFVCHFECRAPTADGVCGPGSYGERRPAERSCKFTSSWQLLRWVLAIVLEAVDARRDCGELGRVTAHPVYRDCLEAIGLLVRLDRQGRAMVERA